MAGNGQTQGAGKVNDQLLAGAGNQKLLFARLLLALPAHQIAVADALAESALHHLECAYRRHLLEIAANYQCLNAVSTPGIHLNSTSILHQVSWSNREGNSLDPDFPSRRPSGINPDILNSEPGVDTLMSSSLYQIVMLPSGDVVLQRTDDTGEQLVRITFSDEVRSFLGAASMDVAKAMIDAGIDVVEHMGVAGQLEEEDDEHSLTLH
ncbi:MAG: hypothetical protein ACSLE5_12975 [Porticoccaceae bacterium]